MVLFSSISFAGGFRLPEQGAAATGMSGAFVGQADDPSAVWYNPAGITQLDGTRIAGGFVAVYPYFSHETGGTTEVSKRDVHFPIILYATHKMNDKISFGLGVNNPFGLTTDWSATSETHYVATFSKIVTTEFNPNIAYKVNNDLSVAFGVAYIHLRATLEKTQRVILPGPVDLGDHNFRLSGDGDGWGANAAVLYRISEKANAGLSYRSRIKIDIDGTAELTGGPAAQSGSANTSITLPDLIQLGISYKASDNLTINADLDYTLWSTYDRIVVTSDNSTFNNNIDEKQWKDVWALKIGGQYKLSDQWKLRAGYYYDKNPAPVDHFETRVPDSDRQSVSIGAGYTVNKVTVDAAYQYIWFKNRAISNSPVSSTLNGSYKSVVDAFALMVSYKF
jgi:long-chain fatty acid transport protein